MEIGYDFKPIILVYKNMNLNFINPWYLVLNQFNFKFHHYEFIDNLILSLILLKNLTNKLTYSLNIMTFYSLKYHFILIISLSILYLFIST